MSVTATKEVKMENNNNELISKINIFDSTNIDDFMTRLRFGLIKEDLDDYIEESELGKQFQAASIENRKKG